MLDSARAAQLLERLEQGGEPTGAQGQGLSAVPHDFQCPAGVGQARSRGGNGVGDLEGHLIAAAPERQIAVRAIEIAQRGRLEYQSVGLAEPPIEL